jgi:broad specificity phosphatase PhoE
VKKLYFIRHGESEANVKHLFAGQWDTPLTDLGRQQARLAAEGAKLLNINVIISSSLSRAADTAKIIADEINLPDDKLIISDLFRERNYGVFQKEPYDKADGIDFDNVRHAETTTSLRKRAKAAVDFLNKLEANNILVVSHGTFGRVLQQQILDLDSAIEVPIELEIPNAQIVQWL